MKRSTLKVDEPDLRAARVVGREHDNVLAKWRFEGANAALQLADLHYDPGDISAALGRAHQRYTDPKAPRRACYQPHARAQALERIPQVRERRLVHYDGSSRAQRPNRSLTVCCDPLASPDGRDSRVLVVCS